MKRIEGESYLSYADRACQALEDGLISYGEWANSLIGEEMYSDENLRRCAQFFFKFIKTWQNDEIEQLNDKDRVEVLQQAKNELEKERKRLQTVNSELQKTYREQGRHELFYEKVVEAIKQLPPIEVHPIPCGVKCFNKTGLLCISDLHAGSTYEVKGLYGEVVNKYDFEVMKARMEKLIGLIEADYMATVEYDNLVVAICGDVFENILRASSLTKLREPVIDTVIKTSEFLCQWVAQLANAVGCDVRVVTVGGNHDTCSFLGATPRFEDENLTKLVVEFMKLRFSGVPSIEIAPFSDVAVQNICGVNVMFEHGGDANLQTTIEYFSNLYNIDVDEIYAGHLHRPESKAVGITDVGDRMIYRVGSICGVDTFAKQIRKAARPSAYFALYDDDCGHTWSRTYYL